MSEPTQAQREAAYLTELHFKNAPEPHRLRVQEKAMDELILGEKAIAELYIFGHKQDLGAGTELVVTGPDSFQNHWNQYGAQHATSGVPVIMRYLDRNSKKVVALFQRNLVGPKAGQV